MMDWSKLPNELLGLIAGRLHLIEDYVRFGVVCKSWHLITLDKDCYPCSVLPWMMLTEKENSDIRGFHGIFTNKVYNLYLPEISGRRCWGSSHGWLVTIGNDVKMHLLNPLTRVQLSLPPLHKCPNLNALICPPKEYRDYFVYKSVLSSPPSDPNCTVMAIYSDDRKLAFTRPSDEAWIPLECPRVWFEDIIYLNDNFYAIGSLHEVMVFNLSGTHLQTIAFASSQEYGEHEYEEKYLVELGGEIYIVLRGLYDTRVTDTPTMKTCGFTVYKLDICSEKWEKVDGLGNWSIFLGNNYSFSILVSDDLNCRKNCIYFTDDYHVMYIASVSYDMGIYDLGNHKMEPYLIEKVSNCEYSAPLWIRPSLW